MPHSIRQKIMKRAIDLENIKGYMQELSIKVSRHDRSSKIFVGRSLVDSIVELTDLSQYSKVVVVGDAGASKSVASTLHALERRGLATDQKNSLTLTGGEACKSFEYLKQVWEFFVSQRLDRKSAVIGVGGGALTDLVGFAAATYLRGVAFIAVPTTLLAQVDASVGGKSGINFGGAKNILGSTCQPKAVIIDIDTLATLPERERRSGFAEIVKHGLIADRAYFEKVTSRHHTAWSADELVEIIHRSCEIKAGIVEADETEQGLRKILNFGHTLGHALEAWALAGGMGAGEVLTHGEAISIGMHAAAVISQKRGLITEEELEEVRNGLERVGLPVQLTKPVEEETIRELVQRDKKAVRGQVRWVLLRGIGEAVADQEGGQGLLSVGRVVRPAS